MKSDGARQRAAPAKRREPRAMIRLAWRGKRPVVDQHYSISTEALNFRPSDLARRPVTGQAFLGAPETSIIELNPPGGERLQPDGEHCCATTRAAWTTTPPFDFRIGPSSSCRIRPEGEAAGIAALTRNVRRVTVVSRPIPRRHPPG